MNKYLQPIFLIALLLAWGCKETATQNKVETTTEKSSETLPKDVKATTEQNSVSKHYKHLFVTAKSGLNYRDAPKGKVMGKYPLNTQLKIIEYTKIAETIKDGQKTIEGAWVGVEKGKDTVYVFDGFLSEIHVVSDMKLYNASPYHKEANGNTRTAFLNISGAYFNYSSTDDSNERESLLSKDNLLKDTIRLNLAQRKEFLERSNVSESDKVFIYSINDDSVSTLKVQDLPAIACINIYYSAQDYEKSELDYEFGFDLGNTHNYGDNFVFIGKENPFQTGGLEPILWEKASLHPLKKQFEGYEVAESYKFSAKGLDYFIQNLIRDRSFYRYIYVMESNSGNVIFKEMQMPSEGTHLVPIAIKGDKEAYEYQWTGTLFKNKPPVVFGFLGFSFDCPYINFLDETEPPVYISCDNRH